MYKIYIHVVKVHADSHVMTKKVQIEIM